MQVDLKFHRLCSISKENSNDQKWKSGYAFFKNIPTKEVIYPEWGVCMSQEVKNHVQIIVL